MDTSKEIILIGIGAIIGGVLITVGLELRLYPDYKVKKVRIVSAIGFVTGILLILAGILRE